ncbi:hypothetical protein So717_37610 [Roseobacter cerasinus]|uniref:Uncharacterized protein n=1 Tax=Roseobacter cerasinus TaxID=2602289 RepID=A0A640VUC6_9RHOB|nr:DUF6476 family protein [Roseobacter cerasinus]GFE52008.1 hypothetical protein So717_37610 [Roseobacter cerasinus]
MDTPEPDTDAALQEPTNLRFLRRLVTVLTATMIGGVILIIVLIVMRFNAPPPDLPDSIVLPGGASAISFTQGPDWYAVTTDADEILIFDRVTGQLRKTITID